MNGDFFVQLNAQTGTRFWINNPTIEELHLAISAGAINCTTNPAYCARLLSLESEYMRRVMDEVVSEGIDFDEAAIMIYAKCVNRLMDAYLPMYEKSNGENGFVTMQDDPRVDEDTNALISTIVQMQGMGKNFMAKIPVIEGALQAIEFCVIRNIPICATEVFSISQANTVLDIYEKASRESGNTPIMYVTHISGIFDEYLLKYANREKINIDEAVVYQAGNAIAKKEMQLLLKRGFTMLGGGVRKPCHFTDFIGGNVHITMNWSTAKEIIDADTQITRNIDIEPHQSVIDELTVKFPDFSRAYNENGLQIKEFSKFGPVQLFRNAFLAGWYDLLMHIAKYKNKRAL